MYNKLQLALKYIHFFVTASDRRGHGVHSPFVFTFITEVLNDRRYFYAYERIEALRSRLLQRSDKIEVLDYGAGSSVLKSNIRRVKDIAGWSLKSPKFGQLLFRIVHHYQPRTIIELGTSLGITSAYMAAAGSGAKVITLEGAPAIASIARWQFDQLGLANIELVEGSFDETLPGVLEKATTVDLGFVDGNHRKEPTLRYFNKLLPYLHNASILILDDIHWSREMEEAWEEIKNHRRVTCSIDLFFMGIILFNPDFKEKQHFKIRF